MHVWNECTFWNECITSEHMTVCNEYTEYSSLCKFPYISRPITVIWHDHIIHRVIAYDTQLSACHTGSQSFTCHIDSQVMSFTYQACEGYTRISHIIYITSMSAHLLEPWKIVNKSTLGLAKQPHSANSSCLSHIASSPRLLSTWLVSRMLHRHIQSLWVSTHKVLKQFNIITSLPHITYSINSPLYISHTFILIPSNSIISS